jgi:TfoX/Sxy family transcriptional regulator of competence genes
MAETELVSRIRSALAALPVTERKMFGGVCFMLNGNMVAGTLKSELLVRIGKERDADALARPHARRMNMGRPAPGYVIVANQGTASDKDLKAWVNLAVEHVSALPPKEKKAPPKRTAAKPASRASRRPA